MSAFFLLFSFAVTSKMRFPALKFGGRIVYSRTASEVDRASRELAKKINSMRKGMDQITIGFDIEWKPTFRRGQSLIWIHWSQLKNDHTHTPQT